VASFFQASLILCARLEPTSSGEPYTAPLYWKALNLFTKILGYTVKKNLPGANAFAYFATPMTKKPYNTDNSGLYYKHMIVNDNTASSISDATAWSGPY
jgi:hypothetical protein